MTVDMFLVLKGIEGESTDKTRNKAIEVLAWSWGGSQSGTMHAGSGGGSGKVSIEDLSITKYVDKASPNLCRAMAKGEHIPEALLVVRKAGGKPVEYIKLEMKSCMITSISTGGSGGEDRLTENITINFAKVKLEYTPQKDDGSAMPSVSWQFDITKNE